MKRFACLLIILTVTVSQTAAFAKDRDSGLYLARLAGCIGCHTDVEGGGVPLAGGRALKTPFGIFYSPNITPDIKTGIGSWTREDFIAALKHGIRPDGRNYFPAFPYTSYSYLRLRDMLAIKTYLYSQPAARQVNRPHDLKLFYSWRWAINLWKLLFFRVESWQDNPVKDFRWNRGAYLVRAVTHCGECHTPRNLLGAMDFSRFLAGTRGGPGGGLVANITPHKGTGIGRWDIEDITQLLKNGIKPNFDSIQGSMGEFIRDGLSFLNDEDLNAIITYLRSVPAINNNVQSKSN